MKKTFIFILSFLSFTLNNAYGMEKDESRNINNTGHVEVILDEEGRLYDGILYYSVDETNQTASVISNNIIDFDILDNGCLNIPKFIIHNNVNYLVTSIGDNAFKECYFVITANIPSSITLIGDYAFSGCLNLWNISGLESLESMTEIGSYAFSQCAIDNFIIPESVTNIKDGTFSKCYNLISIEIPSSIISIGEEAFYYCISLKEFDIPASVNSIGAKAFQYCESLESISLPDSMIEIKNYTFSYCSSLASVEIPNTIKVIGDSAFAYCISLKNIELPEYLEEIEDWAFFNCNSLEKIDIPNSVKVLGERVFSTCENLTYAYIGDSVEYIGEACFGWMCNKLQTVNVSYRNPFFSSENGALYDKEFKELIYCPGAKTEFVILPTVTSIRDYAFMYDIYLTDVDIPASVTSIGDFAFVSCYALKKITCRANIPPLCCENSFSTVPTSSAVLYVPENSVKLYQTTVPWNNFTIIVGFYSGDAGIEEISDINPCHLRVLNGSIIIEDNLMNYKVEVIKTDGRTIYKGFDNMINGLSRGVYIVKIGNQSYKIIL